MSSDKEYGVNPGKDLTDKENDDSSTETTGEKKNINPILRVAGTECESLLVEALSMLGLVRNIELDLEDFQILAVYLAYFGFKKHDEWDRPKSIIKLKCSIIKNFEYLLLNNNVLEERFTFLENV